MMNILSEHTPLEEFITKKTNEGMQCGNYSIDLPDLKTGEQYRFHFDATACVGCHCCEVACNEQNANPDDIKWRRVGEMEIGEFPDTLQLFNSMSCNHCIEPECLIGCPTESYIKFDNGIVWHDDPSCIGCQYCTWNCPYEVPSFNKERGIVTKCHMCADKLEVGQSPACVQACPSNAIEIEVFNVENWLKEDMKKEGVAPHLPDVDITKPTTRYTLPKIDENAEIRPADERLLKPAHAEFPLVFMTVLTQISLGAFMGLFLMEIFFSLGAITTQPSFIIATIAFLPSAIGLPLSALHLGRPIMALMAMKNWRTSWLSREAIALGVFTALMSIVPLLYFLETKESYILLLEGVTLIIGILGIYAQSKIYRIRARPSWDRDSTTQKFFATIYVGFLLMSIGILLLSTSSSFIIAILIISLFIGSIQFLIVNKEIKFYQNLNKEDNLYYQYNRTNILLNEHFKKIKDFRINLLKICAISLPILSILFMIINLETIALITIIIATIGALISELSGRYLFYRTVVPLGLAGNFFAGNQRG